MDENVAKIIAGCVLIIVVSTVVLNGDKFSAIVNAAGSNVVNLTKAANGTA